MNMDDMKTIRKKILSDDQFIIGELKSFLTYFNLKHTLRWGVDDSDKDTNESVAEHVYGMQILIEYFLPFYPELDAVKVHSLATWHDMAEAVVSDMPTNSKTDAHKAAETKAERDLATSAPQHLKDKLQSVFSEYEAQTTPEARFVKAIDKIEPVLHLYFISTKLSSVQMDICRKVFTTKDAGWSLSAYRKHRSAYIKAYDVLWRFDGIISEKLRDTGFFHPEADEK